MNRIIKTGILTFAAVLALAASAAAAELEAYIDTDINTGIITVRGNGANYRGQAVSVILAKDKSGFFQEENPIISELVKSGKDGVYSAELDMSDINAGEYCVLVSTKENAKELKFVYTNSAQISLLFEETAKCAAMAELETLFDEKHTYCGISDDLWRQYGGKAAEKIYKNLSACKDAEEFYVLCRSTIAVLRIIDGDSAEEVLEENRSVMSDCADAWGMISDAARKKAIGMISDDGSADTEFLKACAMAQVSVCANWRELAAVVSPFGENPFKKIFDMNTQYANQSNVDTIIQQMFREINMLNSIGDINKRFYEISQGLLSSNNTAVSGGTSTKTSSAVSGFSAEYIPAKADVYTDIEGHWAEGYIQRLSEKKAISGYPDGSFLPDKNITRAEFVQMICSTFSISGAQYTAEFADVAENDWFAAGVAACCARGFVFGSEGLFRPNTLITREEAAVILYRVMSETVQSEQVTSIPFNDVTAISEFAKEAVAVMADEGILTGTDNGNFLPKTSATRAQAAVMILKVYDFISAEG